MQWEGRHSEWPSLLSANTRQAAMLQTNSPKLRSDLIESRQEHGGQVTFIVKDPVDNQFFRLKEKDHFIAAQLDGQTPLETVRRRVQEKFHVALSPEALGQFIASLRKTRLLENGRHGRSRRHMRGRLRGGLLNLRLKVCDPDGLFGVLERALRFCFTPGFVTGSALIILLAALQAVSNWEALYPDFAALISWDGLPWLWASLAAVSIAHEFAHGLTCKHFGGQVRELGLLSIYFLPALYCNVSDAWLFPERRKRLWVSFAGPYFELFAWACAVLAWRATEIDTWLNTAALAVMATSGVKTLVNFNPLIKLDGYYLLSDLLDRPNLRRRAFAHIGDGLKRMVGLGGTQAEAIPRGERWIYSAYGLAAAVFSVSLLAFAIAKFGGSAVAKEHPEAFLLAGSLLGVKLRKRIRRLFGRSSDTSDPEDFSITEDSAEPALAAPESKPARHRRKPRRFSARFVTLLVLLCVAVAAAFYGRMDLRVSGPSCAPPIQNSDVRLEVGGTVEEICVDEGDQVRAGDPIARLSDRETRNELRRTEAEIAQMQAQLRKLEAGPRREEIELAQIAVTRAVNRARLMRKNLDRDDELARNQLLAQKEFEATQHAVVDSTNEVAEARTRLELLRAGSRPEEVEATKAGLARLESQRLYLEEQLRFARVTSPAAGIVATPSRELKEMVGKLVQEGDLIAKVDDLRTVEVESPVSEKDIADVKVGQHVALKARAYPGKTFIGTVTSIGTTVHGVTGASADNNSAAAGSSAAASRSAGAKTVLVTTRIANDGLLLKPGMTGLVKISCGERRIPDLIQRRLVRTFKVEFWSWW